MAKFVFKLQPLLNVKIQMEDNLKNKLGKALQELERQKDILSQIESEKECNINEFREKSSHKITVRKLMEYNVYISFLNEQIISQKENVNCAQDNVDKIREELIKIVQEREILDKLKDRKYKLFLKEQLKEEQRINDEIASYKHGIKFAGEENG